MPIPDPEDRQDFIDALIRGSVQVEQAKSGAVRDLVDGGLMPELEESFDELEGRFRRIRTISRGGDDVLALKGFQEAMRIADRRAREIVQKHQRAVLAELETLATLETEKAQEIAREYLRRPLPKVKPALRRRIVAKRPFNGATLKGWYERQETRVRDEIRREVQEGIVNRESVETVVRRVRSPGSTFHRSTRHQAETIVRTAMQHTSQRVQQETFRQAVEVQREQWLATLDVRTCQVCGSLDRQIYDLDKGPSPPAHPL